MDRAIFCGLFSCWTPSRRTPAKRHLYACHLGAADAPKQLVLTASIHGREYINTTLLLDMLAYYLPRYNHRELPDTPCYRELWRDVCIIFLPMTNPDGVSISQNTPAKKWKENSAGVDLNRNFPCGFGLSKDINKHNPGKSAGDQPETKHLMTFVSQLSTPLGVIHYHSQGSLIYYDYDVTGISKPHCKNGIHRACHDRISIDRSSRKKCRKHPSRRRVRRLVRIRKKDTFDHHRNRTLFHAGSALAVQRYL